MHVAETGCWCRAVVLVVGAGWVLVPVLGAGCARGGDRLLVLGAGAGGCARGGDRLLVCGAGRRAPAPVETGCWCWWYSLHICGDRFCPDSKAMELLLQTTMSCPRAFETGCRCWWAVETGCRCRALVRAVVLVLGAVSWLCTWWRQVAGAGCRVPVAVHVVETGCWWWCWAPGAGAGGDRLLVLVPGAGAGGIACIYVAIFFAQIAKLWNSYFK